MKRIKYAVILSVLLVSVGFGQENDSATKDASAFTPPTTLPDNCSALMLVNLSSLEGSPKYIFLRYQLASIAMAHKANQSILTAFSQSQSKQQTQASALGLAFASYQASVDQYQCAAYVIGKYQPKDDIEEDVRKIYIASFKTLSEMSSHINDMVQKSFEAIDDPSQQTSTVEHAKDLAHIKSDKHEITSNLLELTAMALPTVGSAPSPDAKIDRFMLTCVERKALLTEASTLKLDKQPDEFTDMAGLFRTYLSQPLKCGN